MQPQKTKRSNTMSNEDYHTLAALIEPQLKAAKHR